MDFKEQLTIRTQQAEAVVRSFLPKEEGLQKTVLSAMNYSVLAGGKRLRPLIMEETYRMFGGSSDVIRPFMAAIEMIHTYSLIHDDLPAMDDDEYRRGRKTTHIVYGEAMAILAGDGLLNYAYETAAGAFSLCDDLETAARAFAILAKKAGVFGMVGGQTADVELEGTPLSEDVLSFIFKNKTCALLEASMMVGAVLGGADDRELALIEQAAEDFGRAFQIQDDILDVTGTLEELGKPIGSDAKNEKTTYVTLFGIEQAKKDVRALSEHAVAVLKSLGRDDTFLTDLIAYLIDRRY